MTRTISAVAALLGSVAIAWVAVAAPDEVALGEAAVARGDFETARAHFERAVGQRAATDSLAALAALAGLARRAGNPEAELEGWARVLELDPTHLTAHHRSSALTGPAPRRRYGSVDSLEALALAHPYDPWALTAAGEALVARARSEEAVAYLEKAVWMADRDPEMALQALKRLREIDTRWSERRIVPVHVHCDEGVRSVPGWRFRVRTLWLSASNTLDAVLQTRFVPIAIGAFEAASEPPGLEAMHRNFLARVPPPSEGILAAMVERPAPSKPLAPSTSGPTRKGIARLLGRALSVRLEPATVQSRVLAHEILHLYGAIHVLEGVESLMNPTGTSLQLDPGSYRIATAMRGRAFGEGGIERNVIGSIDLGEATAAYRAALVANFEQRDAAIADARGQIPGPKAAAQVQRSVGLDTHFADASRVTAALMLADGQRAEALHMLEVAAQLYGESTDRGRETAGEAAALRAALAQSPADRR